MGRITIELDDELLERARKSAEVRKLSIETLISESLRRSVEIGELPTFSGGLRPGVNLDDSGALLDLMEGISDPDRR